MAGFVWYELMATDPARAERFYTGLVGWTAADSGMPGVDYRLFSSPDRRVAGLMARPEGAPAMWMGYIGVADIEQAVDTLRRLGGQVHRPPGPIPGVGQFSVVADPQGVVFCLFQPEGEAPALPPYDMSAPGCIGWNELLTPDSRGAIAFYGELCGWHVRHEHELGPMGTYYILGDADGDHAAIFQPQTDGPPSGWTFYANVDAAEPAAARCKDLGGQVLIGPIEVPGGRWIVQTADEDGARFAVLAPERG